MTNILMIGAGQIGSRHLQALALLLIKCNIYVIDTSVESLLTAKTRYEQVKTNADINVFYKSDFSDLPEFIDVAIVATSADNRKNVIVNICKLFKIQYIILEKVLFQSINDYYEINELLEKNKIVSWVNLCTRTWSFYQNLKKQINNPSIELIATGSLWGLGCNSVHFLDLISFLSDSDEYIIDEKFLDIEIINSKRNGYIEFTGMLVGCFSNGSKFILSSSPYKDIPCKTEIITDTFRCSILENDKKALISKVETNWEWSDILYNPPYQSQLTNLFVSDILNSGTCKLPLYQHALKIHLPVLEAFLKHLSFINKKQITLCQIT